MAVSVVNFDPDKHQKVRYDDELYVVCLDDFDFLQLPPDAEVVIHFIFGRKVIIQEEASIRGLYTVRKRDLVLVDWRIER